MKKSRVLALMLVVAMIFSMSATFVVNAEELTPPANSKVRVTEKTVTATFSEDQTKVWDVWDVEGNYGSYTTTGNALNITGGTVPFVVLSGFGSNLENVNEIVVEYKATAPLTIQLRIREKGYSKEVPLDPTNGEYVKASINPTQFEGGTLTTEDIKAFKSVFDPATNKYTSTAMLYISSTDASIKSLNAYWYSYSSESTQVRKELSEDFANTTWGSWGKWTGGGSTEVPLSMEWKAGEGENGGNALVITGGNTGAGSYAGGQHMIPNNWDLTGVDAIRYRYKSTAGINVYFNRAFQINNGERLPASEVETVKGLLGDDYSNKFDADGKNISGGQWKWETKSDGVNLPSSNGQWTTVEVPISKFGSQEFLSHIKTVIVNQSFGPCYHVRFEGCCYGADTSKYFAWGGITAVWFEKLPTMSSIAFENAGDDSNGGLLDGTTDVKVELKNSADIAIEDSVLVAGLYSNGKLLSVDVETVDTPASSTSGVKTLSVTVPDGVDYFDCEVHVMLWDSASTMNQITNLAVLDAFGYYEVTE